MELLVKYLFGDQDLSGSKVQWEIVGYSFFFFFCIYLSSVILSQLSATYEALSNREKVFWHLSIVRAVFGVFAAYVGAATVLGEPELHADVVNGKTQTSYFNIMMTTGFFAFECTMLFGSNLYFGYVDWNLTLHHLLSLLGYLMAVYYDANHFFGTVGMLVEMTTPFSCLCYLLIKAKMADTKLWRVNQMILIHLFHCRTIVELYLWWATYQNFNLIWNEMPIAIAVFLYSELTLIFFYLTPFWTYKKTCQLFNPVDWNHAGADTKKKTKKTS